MFNIKIHKQPNDSKSDKTQQTLNEQLKAISRAIFNHRSFIIFLILALTVGASLLLVNKYVSVERNEDLYTQKINSLNYKKIDAETLKNLRNKYSESNINVNTDYDPNRLNPFTDN